MTSAGRINRYLRAEQTPSCMLSYSGLDAFRPPASSAAASPCLRRCALHKAGYLWVRFLQVSLSHLDLALT